MTFHSTARPHRLTLLAVATCLALALAGCGGGSEGDGTDDGPKQVKVGMLPILPTAALYAGIEEGFFEDRGIEVSIETGQGGAALLPAVMAGELQFASSNPVSLLTARDKGLDVQVVSHWTSDAETAEEAINAVIARGDSGIESPADLVGKRVAINTLSSMGDLTIRELVRQDGGDPDAVEFVELPFPDMPPALGNGQIDAVWVPEPFMSGLLAEDNVAVAFPTAQAVPGMPTQLMFTSPKVLEEDPQLVEDMTAALEETLEFAEENPDAVRAQITSVIPDLPEEVADNVRLEVFGTDLRKDQVAQVGELMAEEGWLDNEPDVAGLYGE